MEITIISATIDLLEEHLTHLEYSIGLTNDDTSLLKNIILYWKSEANKINRLASQPKVEDVIVLTIREIYNLAVFAGLWINEEDSTNDRTSEIAIRENITIPMDSGETDWHGRAAYYVDYPEDKSVIIKEYYKQGESMRVIISKKESKFIME